MQMHKSALAIGLLTIGVQAAEGDLLRVRSAPKYPLPGEPIERTIELVVRPAYPSHRKFERLCAELGLIANDPSASSVPMHEANWSFEITCSGRRIEVVYTKSKAQASASTKQGWESVFRLVRDVSSERIRP